MLGRIFQVASGLLLGVLVSSSVLADITLTYTNPDQSGGDMVMTVTGGRAAMKFPSGQGQQGRMIFDQAENKLYMVMDEQQQYMDMDAMVESLSGLSGVLSGMMENLPDDAKGELSGMLGGLLGNKDEKAAPAEPKLVETGQNDEIAGISCAVTKLQTPGQETELCLAKPGAAGVSDDDFAIMRAMMVKQRESADQATQILGIGDIGFNPGKIDRVPLRIKQISGAGAGSMSELKSVSENVDAAAVQIPDSYNLMQMTGS